METKTEQKVWTMNKNYEDEYFDWKYKAIVKIQEDSDYPNPRVDWDNVWKLCIREHRNYTFPNELNFRWDYFDNGWEDCMWNKVVNLMEEIQKRCYVFWIDMYEHSGIVFSMLWEGMNCRFDTSRAIGFWAIPKVYNGYDLKEIGVTEYTPEDWDKYMPIKVSYEEAEEIARQELKDWNQWCSGEIYEYSVYKLTTWTSEDWDVKETWDYVEGCGWYYDKDYAQDEAVSMIEYLKNK